MSKWPGVELCKDWKGKIPESAHIEPKIDGVRAVIIMGDKPMCRSRVGKPLYNVGHIMDSLPGGYVYDGELFSVDFNTTVSISRSFDNGNTDLGFYAFDILSIEDFFKKRSDITLFDRRYFLKEKVLRCSHVIIPERTVVHCDYEINALAQQYIKRGYEGVVLKDQNSFYSFRRSGAWQKVKAIETGDYKITGMIEGKGKYKGTLGALIVSGCGIKPTNVGGGFTDEVRHIFWNNGIDSVIGKTVEVQHFGKTSQGSIRHPVYLRMRPDKD